MANGLAEGQIVGIWSNIIMTRDGHFARQCSSQNIAIHRICIRQSNRPPLRYVSLEGVNDSLLTLMRHCCPRVGERLPLHESHRDTPFSAMLFVIVNGRDRHCGIICDQLHHLVFAAIHPASVFVNIFVVMYYGSTSLRCDGMQILVPTSSQLHRAYNKSWH